MSDTAKLLTAGTEFRLVLAEVVKDGDGMSTGLHAVDDDTEVRVQWTLEGGVKVIQFEVWTRGRRVTMQGTRIGGRDCPQHARAITGSAGTEGV